MKGMPFCGMSHAQKGRAHMEQRLSSHVQPPSGTPAEAGPSSRKPGGHSRKKVDLTGQRFGRQVVLQPAANIGDRTAWLCRCDCDPDYPPAQRPHYQLRLLQVGGHGPAVPHLCGRHLCGDAAGQDGAAEQHQRRPRRGVACLQKGVAGVDLLQGEAALFRQLLEF